MKRIPSMALVAAACTVCSAPIVAQEMVSSPVRYGVTAGATFPTGDLSDRAKVGWNAGALVELGFPIVPLSFRFDAAWHQLGNNTDIPDTEFKSRVISGDLNAVYTFAPANPTKFYLIGGLGIYNIRTTFTHTLFTVQDHVSADRVIGQLGGGQPTETTTASSTKFGVNAGAGVRFQFNSFSTFVEARFHNVFGVNGGNSQMIPITVGVVF